MLRMSGDEHNQAMATVLERFAALLIPEGSCQDRFKLTMTVCRTPGLKPINIAEVSGVAQSTAIRKLKELLELGILIESEGTLQLSDWFQEEIAKCVELVRTT